MRLTVDIGWRNDKKETNPASTIDFVVTVISDCVYHRKLLAGCSTN